MPLIVHKNIAYIVLSFLVLLNGMTFTVIQLDFTVHREAIAELLCINKDKPELECNGKCELSRRLDVAQEHEDGKSILVQLEVLPSYLPTAIQYLPIQSWTYFKPKFNNLVEIEQVFLSIVEVFHPPQG